jgi:gamma-butyrobetaine dioxygenase
MLQAAKYQLRRAPCASFNPVAAGTQSIAGVRSASWDDKQLELQWEDGHTSRFHNQWLRKNCSSRLHGTGQLLPQPHAPHLRIASAHVVDEERIDIHWDETNNVAPSSLELDWLRQNCYSTFSALAEQTEMIRTGDALPRVVYADIMGSDEGLFEWMHHVHVHGLCVVTDMPCVEGEVKRLAQRISPISHDYLYGDTFDVQSKHDPVNIAYTSEALPLHMDLSYYESPPGIQLLHAMRFDKTVQGGDSLFIDAHLAAETLRRIDPDAFRTLCTVPATFHKEDLTREPPYKPVSMRYQRPHITVNADDEVIAVFWSPPFEGPLCVDPALVEPYYHAYQIFEQLMSIDEPAGERQAFVDSTGCAVELPPLLEFKLEEGCAIVFNQRRMLHGRRHFEQVQESGARHFQGTYLNIDEFRSRYRVIGSQLGVSPPVDHRSFVHKLGNASHR